MAAKTIIEKENPTNSTIDIFWDSMSNLALLQSIPTKPKPIPTITQEIIEHIYDLTVTRGNKLTFHYTPSHKGIGKSDDVDELAKEASNEAHDDAGAEGTAAEQETNNQTANTQTAKTHITTLKKYLEKWQKNNLEHYINQNIKPSATNTKYPRREGFKNACMRKRETNNNGQKEGSYVPVKHHPLLNRARSGHTRCKDHLHRMKIVKDNKCEHCERHPETLEHVLLHCQKLQTKLKKQRENYTHHTEENTTTATAVWTHPTAVIPLLNKAQQARRS